MKNQILDDIFHDKLLNNLEEGEIVFWDGSPRFNGYSMSIAIGFLFVISGASFYNAIQTKELWMIISSFVLFLFMAYHLFSTQKRTRYLITNLRIIFQLPSFWKTKIHSLPLNQIEHVHIDKEGGNNGNIFLELKKSFKADFKTTNLKTNSHRKMLTLELIENFEDVAKIIDKGTQGKF